MIDDQKLILGLFYCQNVPGSSERDRKILEKKYGKCIRFFPIPCSGRLESLHLLRALEDFADAAYVITCPEGACRYFEGNQRAIKRVERTRSIIASIGLEEERVGIVTTLKEKPRSLDRLAGEILDRVSQLRPSPALHRDV